MFRCRSAKPTAYSQITRPCQVTAMAIDGTPDATRSLICEATAEKSNSDLVACAWPGTDCNAAETTKARNVLQIRGMSLAWPKCLMFLIDGSRLRFVSLPA